MTPPTSLPLEAENAPPETVSPLAIPQGISPVTSQVIPQVETPQPEIIYPDSDGQPMSDNTEQFSWIVAIKENLERLLADNPDVFVAGDLLWYPVDGGDPSNCQAPDTMVVFGRPKGYRGSYKQWEEGNIPPQVVFEIRSPGDRRAKMNRKLLFYNQYNVEEYYLYNPAKKQLSGWLRRDGFLDVIENLEGWVSPRLQIRFELTTDGLEIHPAGDRFLSFAELAQLKDQRYQRADAEAQRAEAEAQRAEAAEARIRELEARFRSLGVDP